jgi:hypothetical protein
VRPSVRFLALAVFGWAGVRAASLGVLPGRELFRIEHSEAKAPPIVATQFPAIEPVAPAAPMIPADYPMPAPSQQSALTPPVRYVQAVVGVPVTMRRGIVPVYQLPPAEPARETELPPPRSTQYFPSTIPPIERALYSQLPSLDPGPLAGIGGPVSRPGGALGQSIPLVEPHGLDRLQLTTWALLRGQQSRIAGSRSLATGGQLGASQAGARLIYNLDRRLALTGRLSSEVGRRGGEVAGGVRVQPLVSIPVWVTAERRQAVGKYGGGRSAFAFFLEGGVYDRPLPWSLSLDSYLQGGVVGLSSRDLFVDGDLWVTRPVYRNFSAGFGVWGGAQPGLYRVDGGPRITMRVRKNVKLHLDWRQKLAGNATPGSGPALTLAGDF